MGGAIGPFPGAIGPFPGAIPVCVITETAVKIGTVFVKVARNEV